MYSNVYIFNVSNDRWLPFQPPNAFAPTERFDHCAAITPDGFQIHVTNIAGLNMIIYGGWIANRTLQEGIFMFSLSSNQWIDISPLSNTNVPQLRAIPVCACPRNDKFIMAGGQTSEFTYSLSDGFWTYDLTTRSWSSVFLSLRKSYNSFT